MKNPPIGLLGGTGHEGKGIGGRLAAAGLDVIIGSRRPERAAQAADDLNQRIGAVRASGQSNHELFSSCEILFLTVPFEHAAPLLQDNRGRFREQHIVVDVTVPLRFEKGPRLQPLEAGSGAQHIRRHLPSEVPLVATFKTLPAALLMDLETPLDCDEIVCHDSKTARDRVLEVLKMIPSVRWLDGGPLRYCQALEAMTMLVIGLNRRYKSHQGRFRVLGV